MDCILGCTCAGFDMQAVIGIVPFNFFQRRLPGSVTLPDATCLIGGPNNADNASKYLNAAVYWTQYATPYQPALPITLSSFGQYDRITGGGTTGGWNLGYELGVPAANYVKTGAYSSGRIDWLTATENSVSFQISSSTLGGPWYVSAQCDITLFNEVTYAAAAADATALLANVALLSPESLYTAIVPSSLVAVGGGPGGPGSGGSPAITTEVVNFGYSSDPIAAGSSKRVQTLIVTPNTAVDAHLSNAVFANAWTGINLVENAPLGISTLFGFPNEVTVCANGNPGYTNQPFMSGQDGKFFQWPPTYNGAAYLTVPEDWSRSVSNLDPIMWIVSMKSVVRIPAASRPTAAFFDLTTGLYTPPTALNQPALAGEHIFLPADIAGSYGIKAMNWRPLSAGTSPAAGNPGLGAGGGGGGDL